MSISTRLSRIASRIERRYSPAANLTAPGFTASMTVPSVAGVMVTPQTALTFSAFFGAVHVISEDMAGLPLQVFQRNANGTVALVKQHRINDLFNCSADGECPSFNWREARTGHVASWGNGYAEIIWDKGGEIERLMMIHPSLILPKRDQKTGKLYYELQTADSISGPRGRRIALPYQIYHTAGLGFNGLVGYSVVALQREMIGMGKAVEQFGAAFFGNGATPSGVIQFARQMKPEALKNFRESWNLVHQGSAGAHKIAVLEEGATWVETQIPPEDAQFLATRAFQVLEICRIFRLPPHKLADFSESHLANVEAANEDYIATCLRGWAQRDEAAINWRLLLPEERAGGLYVKHDFRPLLLRTAKDEADFLTKLFNIGYYSVDEMRVMRGDNPIGIPGGGDKRFVQTNLVDLTKAGDPAPKGQEPKPDGKPGRPEKSSRINEQHDPKTGQFAPGGKGPKISGGSGAGGGLSEHDAQAVRGVVSDAKAKGFDIKVGKGSASNPRESKALAKATKSGGHAVSTTETPKVETVKRGEVTTHRFAEPTLTSTARTYPDPVRQGRWVSSKSSESTGTVKTSHATRGQAIRSSKGFMRGERSEATVRDVKVTRSVAKTVKSNLEGTREASIKAWQIRVKVVTGGNRSLLHLPRFALNGLHA